MKIVLKEIYTFSNLLSLLRVFLAIPFWIIFNNLNSPEMRMIAFALCIFAAVTDILDGYLARKFNEVTEFGKIIDPLADKICVAAIVIPLYTNGLFDATLFWIIILRDVLIFISGIFLSKKIGKVLPSNFLGKIAVVTICLYFLMILGDIQHSSIGKIFYYMIILLSFASLVGYGWRSIDFLKKGEN